MPIKYRVRSFLLNTGPWLHVPHIYQAPTLKWIRKTSADLSGKKKVIKEIEKIAMMTLPRILIREPMKFCIILIFRTPATFAII